MRRRPPEQNLGFELLVLYRVPEALSNPALDTSGWELGDPKRSRDGNGGRNGNGVT